MVEKRRGEGDQVNPLDGVDIIFKDEGDFWKVEALTAAGRAFMQRTRLLRNARSNIGERRPP